jgi:hypothetical protein
MKNDNWIVYGIIALTSTTTVLTMLDGSFFGLLRGVGFAIVLDGFIIFWESRSEALKEKKQRDWANGMKWAGLAMLLAIALAYAFVSLVPVDAVQKVDVFGMTFASTVREVIHWVIVGMISLWVVLTLGVIMFMREIDPDTAMKLEYTKAAQERQQEKLTSYKIANKYTQSELGKLEALEEYRADLVQSGRYTEGEVVAMVLAAGIEIDRQKVVPQKAIPASAVGLQLVNNYQHTAEVPKLENTPKADSQQRPQ